MNIVYERHPSVENTPEVVEESCSWLVQVGRLGSDSERVARVQGDRSRETLNSSSVMTRVGSPPCHTTPSTINHQSSIIQTNQIITSPI